MQEKTKITSKKHSKLHIFVTYVFRANFNDEMYLLDKDIFLDELDGKGLVWFDPYLGRSKINDTEIAILWVGDNDFRILKRKPNAEDTQEEKSLLGSLTLVEDFNQSCLLASHIDLRR